jgi:uncharacterized membrane protein YoaK (UPF0700 family)
VTGLADAVSFLALGRVFTANMTGNVVLLAFAIAGTEGLSIPRSVTALVAFVLGALIGGRMATAMSSGPRYRWTGTAFGIEATLLLAATAIAGCYGNGFWAAATGVYSVIVLSGLAMGVRNATVRKLGVPDLTTTVLTLTITGLAADSTLGGGSNPGWKRRTAAVAAMFTGAALGAWLLLYSIAVPLALATVVTGLCAVAAYHARTAE